MLAELGDGESCTNVGECSYTNAQCVADQCTCPDTTYVNEMDSACSPSKF